jgi:membrane protein YqaA with SNARE-associated domain
VVSGLGSVAGAMLGWLIGYTLWSAVEEFFFRYVPGFTPEVFQTVRAQYESNAMLAIFGAAFTPIPFKVFTICAGVCHISLAVLVVASSLGRFARFFAVAACVFVFGPGVKQLLEKYFGLATCVFFVLLVGGFLLIKYLIR